METLPINDPGDLVVVGSPIHLLYLAHLQSSLVRYSRAGRVRSRHLSQVAEGVVAVAHGCTAQRVANHGDAVEVTRPRVWGIS